MNTTVRLTQSLVLIVNLTQCKIILARSLNKELPELRGVRSGTSVEVHELRLKTWAALLPELGFGAPLSQEVS